MKFRLDFVTNSSSSCYICEICHNAVDVESLEDAGMAECHYGHTFCRSHIQFPECHKYIAIQIAKHTYGPDSKELAEILSIDPQEFRDFGNTDEDSDMYTDLPEEFCPICSFQALTKTDGFVFLKKDTGITNEMILQEFKTRFGTYKKFMDFLAGRDKV